MLPMNTTGKHASEWAQVMSDLRGAQPRPIHKLWNNPALADPAHVAAQQARIKEWNRQYRFASKMQKIALEQDNAAFHRS